jgi:outer membrane protein OmpA-like peptidoglycan-associated protein
MPTDQFFATDRHQIHPHARQSLANFFQQANARAYLVHGHTDSRASDEYNMALSLRRADAVAGVARSAGANVIDVRGFGERMPRATNSTSDGMAQNRRVEIICIR